jgi:hypothetical protein
VSLCVPLRKRTRYAADVTADEQRWELCERVLARTDVTKRLSRGWGERIVEAT